MCKSYINEVGETAINGSYIMKMFHFFYKQIVMDFRKGNQMIIQRNIALA